MAELNKLVALKQSRALQVLKELHVDRETSFDLDTILEEYKVFEKTLPRNE